MRKDIFKGAVALIGFVALQAHATVTIYDVSQTYNQVVYNSSNPTWDTLFNGSFSYDSVTNTISNFNGVLTQAMTGNSQSRDLTYQLSTGYNNTLGGWVVSVFYQNSTDVFQGGGFATGGTKEFGNQNAYVTMFFNPLDPSAALSNAQLQVLAYGDCTTGSLMGMGAGSKTCMTGWAKNTAGILSQGGTMQGTWPITQTITAVPEPENMALVLTGLSLIGWQVRRTNKAFK